ncbi:MAG: hypothetical protein KAJ07_02660 [Planctomycetes bacterium]|nr:hypothetical protein [Planctomycetota bacterium]
MKTICSECDFAFKVPRQMEGRSVKCPQCRHQMEISRSPTPAGVKILKAVLPAMLSAAISILICWGYFNSQDQLEISRKVSDAQKFFEKKLDAEQQKTGKLAVLLKAKADSASMSALRSAEEVDSLNKKLTASRKLVEEKDRQIAFMVDILNKLDEAVTTESEQRKLQQESDLQQALVKGSDIWSLSGIRSLGVAVKISGNDSTYQLKESDIVKHAHASLEQNDIAIAEGSDAVPGAKDAVLSLEIFILENDDSGKAASVNMTAELKQSARLLRDDTIICVGASTWKKQRWHVITAETANDAIKTMLDDLLERFISDFHSSRQP